MAAEVTADGAAAQPARRPREPGCIPSGEASFSPAAHDDVARLHRLAAAPAAVLGQLRHLRADRGDRLRPGDAQPLERALLRRHREANVPVFLHQLLVFAYIAGALLVLNIAQGWLNRYLHIKLREGLVRDLLDEWLKPGRALRLQRSGEIGVNPDQRLHEDAWHLADLSADLGIGFVQAACCWSPSSACCGRSRKALSSLRRPQLRHPRLHGVGSPCLCGRGVRPVVAARPAAGAAQRRPLCARGRTQGVAGRGEPGRRGDRPASEAETKSRLRKTLTAALLATRKS